MVLPPPRHISSAQSREPSIKAMDKMLSLQRQQAEFDESHGLGTIGASGNDPMSGIDLGMAQFATLALCGESGELANALKKAMRASALGRSTVESVATARGELADVYAYLLKLASILDVDLEEEYLETLGLNSLRFSIANATAKTRVVGIAGADAASAAREFVNSVLLATPGGAVPVTLQIPEIAAAQRFTSWLRESQQLIQDQLRKSRDGIVVLSPDPAVSTLLFRLQERSGDARREAMHQWIALEKIIWEAGADRSLVLLPGTTSRTLNEKLAKHGAHVLSSPVDWSRVHQVILTGRFVPSENTP